MTRKPILIIVLVLWLCSTAQAQGWLWARGNVGAYLDGWPVATDQTGNVFIAGVNMDKTPAVLGVTMVPKTAGLYDHQCIIAKYDSTGQVLWAKGTQNGEADLIGIATDLHGNVYMLGTITSHTLQIGSFTLTNAYPSDVQYFIAKFDPSGNVLWALNAGNAQWTKWSYPVVGTFANVMGVGGITTDAAGNVYVTTNFSKPSIVIGSNTLINADPSGKTEDILIAKYDPSGNLLWATRAGGTGNDDAYGITVTPAGDVYIAGVFESPSLTFGASVLTKAPELPDVAQMAFIARFDHTGNAVWGCSSGGEGGEYAVGIASDPYNNVYLTGGVKDTSISFSGTTITNPTPGRAILYLVKFDNNNSVSWYKVIHSASPAKRSQAWGYCISMSPCGVIWVSGSMVDSVNIDGNILVNVDNFATDDTSERPMFIAGYTASGSYVGSASLTCGADDQNGIACDALGNVYICADYSGKRNVSAGKDVLLQSPGYYELLYFAKYASLNSNTVAVKSSYTTLCEGQDVLLSAPAGYSTCLWDDGGPGKTRHVSESGVFWVSSLDSCVSHSYDTFSVHKCDCSDYLFVPNTFTPNGDGENDVFYPRCRDGISLITSFRVYNRWGVLIFERENISPNDKTNAWDGTYNNQEPTNEVFVWVVEAVCQNGSVLNRKGSVTAVR